MFIKNVCSIKSLANEMSSLLPPCYCKNDMLHIAYMSFGALLVTSKTLGSFQIHWSVWATVELIMNQTDYQQYSRLLKAVVGIWCSLKEEALYTVVASSKRIFRLVCIPLYNYISDFCQLSGCCSIVTPLSSAMLHFI